MKRLQKTKIISLGLSAVVAMSPLVGAVAPVFADGSNHVKVVVRSVDGQAVPNATLTVEKVGYQTPRFDLNSSGRYSFDTNGRFGSSATALKTNGQGIADFNGLPNGDYTFDFVGADAKTSTGPVQASVNNESKEIDLKADVNSGAISISLTKATGEAISHAGFCLKKGSSKIPVAQIPSGYTYGVGGSTEFYTNVVGRLMLSNVPVGEYDLVQMDGPSGLKLVTQKVSVSKGQISTLTFSATAQAVSSSQNKIPATLTDLNNAAPSAITPSSQSVSSKKGNLKIHVVDSVTKNPVAGYKFSIDSDTFIQKDSSVSVYDYGDKSGTETSVVSDSNGYIQINGLPEGKVNIKQSAAASGYALSLAPVTQTITEGKTSSCDLNVVASGYAISVKDSKNVGIKSVLLEVFNKSNAVILAGETDAKGTLQISGLTEGTYKIKVENVPSGYMGLADTVPLTISADGKIVNAKPIVLQPSTLYLQSDCMIAGFGFELKDAETGRIYRATTEASGIATVSSISQGRYEITQKTAPNGFKVSTEKKYISIDGKYSSAATIKFKNADLMKTSSSSPSSTSTADFVKRIVAIILVALGAFAGTVAVLYKRQKMLDEKADAAKSPVSEPEQKEPVPEPEPEQKEPVPEPEPEPEPEQKEPVPQTPLPQESSDPQPQEPLKSSEVNDLLPNASTESNDSKKEI